MATVHSDDALHSANSDLHIYATRAVTVTEQRLEQELADLRAAVVCAKETKQAQEEHYLRQIIKVGPG
jgi:hypothetical protein